MDYKPFLIANFRTGFDEALEPWLLPRDAFQIIRNAHLYRGVIEKIPGYTNYTVMSYRTLVALTGTIDGANKTFTGTLASLPTTNNIVVQSTIDAGATTVETFSDDGTGTLTGSNGGTGTLNYGTGGISVTFGAAAPVSLLPVATEYNCVIAQYDSAPGTFRPIMGILTHYLNDGSRETLIFDTKRMGKVVVLEADMATAQQLDYGVSEVPHETQTQNIATGFNNTVGPFTGTVTTLLVPDGVTFTLWDSTASTANLLDTITDNGAGKLLGSTLDPAQPNYINYATGQWTMTFLANRPATDSMNFSGCVYGDIFTGTISNFFENATYNNISYIVNGNDPPFYYDGTLLRYLNTRISSIDNGANRIAPYTISSALHVIFSQQRLIFLRPTVNNVLLQNYAYWSAFGAPQDWTGGENLPASTSESIRAFSQINTDITVRFSNSTRILRYTGDAFSPFRWDTANSSFRCDGPYSAINYDTWFSSIGLTAIVASDAVNDKRADEIIPDFVTGYSYYDDLPMESIDPASIVNTYGYRFDDIKEGWLCYKSYDNDSSSDPSPSTNVLAYNYLDGTYSVYDFPFSCLGTGQVQSLNTWGNAFTTWGSTNTTWGTNLEALDSVVDLGGDQNGKVYLLNSGSQITNEAGTYIDIAIELITKNFNPFVEEGELCRFGYLDLLVSSATDSNFRVQFYADAEIDEDFDTYYQETTINLASTQKKKVWKRIYVGAVAQSHTIRIYQNSADFSDDFQPLNIHAIVPYFKSAGRIFN